MKRTQKNLIVGILSCIMVLSLTITPTAAFNKGETNSNLPIMGAAVTELEPATTKDENSAEQNTAAIDALMTDSVVSQLAAYNLEGEMPASISLIENDALGRDVTRLEFETYRVDVDQEGTVVSIFNYEDMHDADTSIIGGDFETISAYKITEDEVMAFADKMVNDCELSGYELVERTNEIPAVWILTWNKRLAEGVLNPYDVITVTIDARDGSVMLMERNSVTPI